MEAQANRAGLELQPFFVPFVVFLELCGSGTLIGHGLIPSRFYGLGDMCLPWYPWIPNASSTIAVLDALARPACCLPSSTLTSLSQGESLLRGRLM